MITQLTKQDLIDFEQDIAICFEHKQIRAPVHLDGGNEDKLIEIFHNIREQDWVCCTWRSHIQCLLKGVPPEELKKKILAGHSISLNFADYKIVSSAIVGGICPIALGLAQAAKLQNKDEHVWVFVGEMSATTGIFFESWNYVVGHDLPITFVIADNNKAVCTPTREIWKYNYHPMDFGAVPREKTHIIYYQYTPKWPHQGVGKFVNF